MKYNNQFKYLLEAFTTTSTSINEIKADVEFYMDRYIECSSRTQASKFREECSNKIKAKLDNRLYKFRKELKQKGFEWLITSIFKFFFNLIMNTKSPVMGKYIYVFIDDYGDIETMRVKIKMDVSDYSPKKTVMSLDKALRREGLLLIAVKQVDE